MLSDPHPDRIAENLIAGLPLSHEMGEGGKDQCDIRFAELPNTAEQIRKEIPSISGNQKSRTIKL